MAILGAASCYQCIPRTAATISSLPPAASTAPDGSEVGVARLEARMERRTWGEVPEKRRLSRGLGGGGVGGRRD